MILPDALLFSITLVVPLSVSWISDWFWPLVSTYTFSGIKLTLSLVDYALLNMLIGDLSASSITECLLRWLDVLPFLREPLPFLPRGKSLARPF